MLLPRDISLLVADRFVCALIAGVLIVRGLVTPFGQPLCGKPSIIRSYDAMVLRKLPSWPVLTYSLLSTLTRTNKWRILIIRMTGAPRVLCAGCSGVPAAHDPLSSSAGIAPSTRGAPFCEVFGVRVSFLICFVDRPCYLTPPTVGSRTRRRAERVLAVQFYCRTK